MKSVETNKLQYLTMPEVPFASGLSSVSSKKDVFIFYTAGRGSVDSVEIKERDIDDVYKLIKDICDEYDMDYDMVKRAQLLEQIAGCSSNELLTKSLDELNNVIKALKTALTRDWKVFWKDRDFDDIQEIAKDANAQYIRNLTGGSWIGQKFDDFWNEPTLTKQLVKDGFLYDKKADDYTEKELIVATKRFFIVKYLNGIENLDEEEQLEKYKLALSKFGYIINRCSSANERAALTSVIAELACADRKDAIKALLASSGNNIEERSNVAKAIDIEEITTKSDATNAKCSQKDAMEMSSLKYAAMTEEDIKDALAELGVKANEFYSKYKEELKEIEEILSEYPEEERTHVLLTQILSEEQLKLYYISRNSYVAQWAGATVGVTENLNVEPPAKTEIINTIVIDASAVGKLEEVAASINDYIESKPKGEKNSFIENFEQIISNELKDVLNKCKDIKDLNDISKPILTEDNDDTKFIYKDIENVKKQDLQISELKDVEPEITIPIVSQKEKSIKDTEQVDNNLEQEVVNIEPKKTKSNLESVQTKEKVIKADSLVIACQQGTKALREYTSRLGMKNTVKELVSDKKKIIPKAFLDKCICVFKYSFSTSEQRDTLMCASNSYLNLLLNSTSNATLLSMEGKTLSNFDATNKVKNLIEERKEDKSIIRSDCKISEIMS